MTTSRSSRSTASTPSDDGAATATATTSPEPTGSGSTARASSGRTASSNTGRRRSTPPRVQARSTGNEESAQDVSGIVGDASASVSRSGEDVRKRGWFWHWNSIVTQYAPLLGLKGVGLLNSYTVWTDRREESPHRGYAFPSQQSEADFYGEDRAELITINKILVALDLIEIRKEMVLRVDAQGRRWKVPHNLYRVKDHGDDASLTTGDVLRVIDLADRDRAVYRYLRRVFSPRFSPIDHANVWHQILEEVRPSPVWQRLAARAEKEERKASERTKAGHASRKENTAPTADVNDTTHRSRSVSETGSGAFLLPARGDNATSEATDGTSNDTPGNDSVAGEADANDRPQTTSVEYTNTGSGASVDTDVESGNNGLGQNQPSTVEATNTGRPTIVAPSNTTYHQSQTTTTTTGVEDDKNEDVRRERPAVSDRFGSSQAPDASRDEAIALQRFAEANDRQPTAAERRHLRQLADFAYPIVEPGETSAWHLVASAIEEAVAAGSSFVAPKRIREILARWSRDGVPGEYVPTVHGRKTEDSVSTGRRKPVTRIGSDGHNAHGLGNAGADLILPNGRSAHAIWVNVGREVAAALGEALADRLLAGTSIAAYEAGAVTIRLCDTTQGEALLGEHASLLERALRAQLRRPVRLASVLAETDDAVPASSEDVPLQEQAEAPAPRSTRARPSRSGMQAPLGAIPVFTVERCGLTNRQLWSMALGDLREGGLVPAADIDAWLRDASLLSMDDANETVTFLLGVPHVLAQRRVEARFRSAITATLATLLGDGPVDVELDVTIIREWHTRQSA